MLVSSECICMDQNNKDPHVSKRYLKGKNRKVTTKTCCDITARNFFKKPPKSHTVLRAGFLWKTCFAFFQSPWDP